jgi:nucleoside-diphosphate-sugar epimerase
LSVRVLVTGATGFIGAHLIENLLHSRCQVTAILRRHSDEIDGRVSTKVIGSFESVTDWPAILLGQGVVVHCAARVHVMSDQTTSPLAEFRKVNVDGTLKLARGAAVAGVKRFVFISSIKVNGEATHEGCFSASDEPAPEDAYGLSKLEAEQGLMQLAAETGMAVVIIRPPLVYGPGVKGNFASMTKLLERGVPLPLGAVHNKRSLVGIGNLVDLLIRCIEHPAAANQVLLAGDGEDLSTTELLRGVGDAMGKPARLIPVPASILQFGATLLGKKAMAQRLLGSLQVDITKTCELLDWKPPYTVQEGLRRCFKHSD